MASTHSNSILAEKSHPTCEIDANNVEKGPREATTSSHEIPNGGFRAWLQVAGGFVLFFNTWGILNIFGVYQTYYELNTGWPQSASDISWIGTIQPCLLFFGGAIAGPFFDMGYLASLLAAGGFLVPFGIMMTSLCNEYWQVLLAQGFCVGIGMGCLFLPSIAIISQYFTTKKFFAFGLSATGSVIGAVIYEVVFRLIQPRYGFGWANRAIGFIVLATMLVPLLGMKQNKPPVKAEAGGQGLNFAAFRNVQYIMYCIALFFAFMPVYVFYFYIQIFALERTDTDPELASYLVAIVVSASIIGRLVPNYLADIVGPLNVQIPLAFFCSLLCFCWIAVQNQSGVVALGVFYGALSGGFTSLPGVTVISLSTDLKMVGIQIGMSMVISGFGVLIGAPIAGAILRGSGGWSGLQSFCGALLLVSFLCMLFTRVGKTGWKLHVKA